MKRTKTHLTGDPAQRRKIRDYLEIAAMLVLLFAACFAVGYLLGLAHPIGG